MDNPLLRFADWLAHRPGQMLLTADEDLLAAQDPSRFRRGWLSVALGSLLWGVVLANVWGISWKVFRDPDLLLMPGAITLALFCLGPYRRAVEALGERIGGSSPGGATVGVVVVIVVLTLSLLRLSPDWGRWEFPALPRWIEWVRPPAKLYRVLVLMPAWGGWAMLVTLKFCRPGERTEPQVAALSAGCDALAVTGVMAALLGISIAYFHHLGLGSQILVPLATIITAIGSGVCLCRAAGGLTRKALLAGNAVTQIVFVLAYLAGRAMAGR